VTSQDAEAVRQALDGVGARRRCEDLAAQRYAEGLALLRDSGLSEEALAPLHTLITMLQDRDR